MKKLLITALLVFGVAQQVSAADAAAGKSLAAACGACHGADGNSAAPNFPKLAGQNAKYLLKQMGDIKSGARSVPVMAGQLDSLNKKQMEDIAAYYAGQNMSLGAAKKDLVALGERVYRAGDRDKGLAACSGCHSPTGQGNEPGGFPKLGGQHAQYVADQLRAFRTGAEDDVAGRHNDGDTRIMRDVAYRLSDKEIEAVASYISGLH